MDLEITFRLSPASGAKLSKTPDPFEFPVRLHQYDNNGQAIPEDPNSYSMIKRTGSDGKSYSLSRDAYFWLQVLRLGIEHDEGDAGTYGIEAFDHYLGNTGAPLYWNGDDLVAKSGDIRKIYASEISAVKDFVNGDGFAYGSYRSRNWAPGKVDDYKPLYFAFRGYTYLTSFDVSCFGSKRLVQMDFMMYKRYNFDKGDSFNGISADSLWVLHGLGFARNFDIWAKKSTSFLV